MKRPVELSKHKSVRIDQRTIILVDRSVPDDVARTRFIASLSRSAYFTKNTKIKEKTEDEIEDLDQEEIVDDEDE